MGREMTREQVFDLMREAGFSTDWTGYDHVQETVAKYERLAELIERQVCSSSAMDRERIQHDRALMQR